MFRKVGLKVRNSCQTISFDCIPRDAFLDRWKVVSTSQCTFFLLKSEFFWLESQKLQKFFKLCCHQHVSHGKYKTVLTIMPETCSQFCRKNILFGSPNELWTFVFSQNIFRQNISLDTQNKVLSSFCKNFCRKLNFFARSQQRVKERVLQKNSQIVPSALKRNFDNPARMFALKVQKSHLKYRSNKEFLFQEY